MLILDLKIFSLLLEIVNYYEEKFEEKNKNKNDLFKDSYTMCL